MKIVVFRFDAGFLPRSSSGTIIAAPEGTPPRRIGDYQKKLPARRASERPDAGVLRI